MLKMSGLTIVRYLVLASFALFAFSCQEKEESQSEPTVEEDAMTDAGKTVEVQLVEYEIQIPTSLSAGPTTFNVTNEGQADHSIAIRNGTQNEIEVLKPGETGTLEIDLAPGEYYVWCPIGSHEAYGMSLTLTVE